ncbi:transporter substrate-binding domain-containing protein [Antarctobacter jejuensis]|uniref:transporter substrate-binding domain-containing protein n=1 Tax=Antarctobacter jejuensis TaxID=1439938 RepID=UPI003FD325CC
MQRLSGFIVPRLAGLLALLLATLCAAPLRAQDSPPLRFALTEMPPFFVSDPTGAPDGFAPELLAAISDLSGLSYRFDRAPSAPEVIQGYMAGDLDGLVAVARLPGLVPNSVFSRPVARTEVRLFVSAGHVGDPDYERPEGKRIGYVDATAGARVDLLDSNIAVPLASEAALLLFLAMGEIDGAVTTGDRIFNLARAVGLDHRILAVGPPLAQFDRVIALNARHADLIPRIDAAIDELDQSGTLARMRRDWGLDLPAPPPDVLTVGVAHYPPYQIVNEDGSFSGFAVTLLRDLAERAGLNLRFREIDEAEFGAGPVGGGYDLLPQIAISLDRLRNYDFTDPIEDTHVSIFVPADQADRITAPEQLQGLRVGVQRVSIGFPTATGLGLQDLVVVETQEELARRLGDGELDAAIYAAEPFHLMLDSLGLEAKVAEVSPPLSELTRGIALRPGLGIAREKLNDALAAYTATDDYLLLRQTYFGLPVFWTLERQLWLFLSLAIFLLIFVLVMALSIQGRRQAERLTAETQAVTARLRAVLNAAQGGIIGLDRAGRISFINPSAAALLGRQDTPPPFDWPAHISFLEPDHLTVLEASKNPVKRALLGQRLSGEMAVLRTGAEQELRYVLVSSARVDGTIAPDVHAVVVLDDVTEAERQRQQLDRTSRMDALGQLTGGIAHDFNNLLATIEFAVQLIADTREDDETRPFVSAALGAVRRGADLTQRLLAFASRQPGLAQSLQAKDVLTEFQGLVVPVIKDRFLLEFSPVPEDLWVYCEEGHLDNALLNLVLNARDAMTDTDCGSRISVSARAVSDLDATASLRNGDTKQYSSRPPEPETGGDRPLVMAGHYVEFTVSDDGPGMSAEVLRRAVDPFFTTKDTGVGSGLGLSMVYGFVQQSQGQLLIESEEGAGTTVRLILPRGLPQHVQEAGIDRIPGAEGQGQRILVVEDEFDLLDMMVDVLRKLGYDPLSADTAAEALDIARSGETIDLLLTDIVMPGEIGGFELAEAVRALRPDIPVLFMSGYTGFSSQEMGKVTAPVLHKPIRPTTLAKAVQEALNPPV